MIEEGILANAAFLAPAQPASTSEMLSFRAFQQVWVNLVGLGILFCLFDPCPFPFDDRAGDFMVSYKILSIQVVEL